MDERKFEKTVELDKKELLSVLRQSKRLQAEAELAREGVPSEELREAIGVIKRWAEKNNQWLLILAPWGMHHYGELTEGQVEQIMKRFTPEE